MKLVQESIGRGEAIRLAESGWWKGLQPAVVFTKQMHTLELCMDFSDFQEATQKALGRPVWTHEFARPQGLWDEFEGRVKVTNPLKHTLEVLSDIRANAAPVTEERE